MLRPIAINRFSLFLLGIMVGIILSGCSDTPVVESNWKQSVQNAVLADFCVLDQDIMAAEAHALEDINVMMTIVGGKIVYDASAEE